MSEKKGDRKLGRNPFDHKKPSRTKRPVSESAPAVDPAPADPQPHKSFESRPPDIPSPPSSGIGYPANQAWFFVDLWAGAIMEPYFFWARSMDMMKKTLEATIQERP